MAFKGMDKRFQENMRSLYDHASTKDGGPGGRNNEPFLEHKPYDPARHETRGDSRLVPIGSIKRDASRLGRFLVSNSGLLFLGTQQALQTANTFSETRLLNPLFVIGNVQPYKRLPRPLTNPASSALSGDQTQMSAGSRGQVGGAGRLQKSTNSAIISKVTTTGGKDGILSFLNPGKWLESLAGAFGVGSRSGSLGINQRPELAINGSYYSIELWKGFQKAEKPRSNLDRAASALRQGQFGTAINAAGSALKDYLFGTVGRQTPTFTPGGRDNPDNTDIHGRRYFITTAVTADRYLQSSILPDGTPSLPYLHRTPYLLGGAPIKKEPGSTFENPFTIPPQQKQQQQQTQARTGTGGGFWSSFGSSFTNSFSNSFKQTFQQTFNDSLSQTLGTTINNYNNPFKPTLSENSAEDNMLFPTLALRQRYETDVRADFVKEQLKAQRTESFKYWEKHKTNTGFVGGIQPGTELNPIPEQKVRFAGGMYLQDALNAMDFYPSPGATQVPEDAKASIRALGEDLINVFFFDFVNGNTIPFRAFIHNITENVSPDVSDTRYIGRIERNIVYVGVTREISFTLKVQAFSESEMGSIWKKINYMTGLCYPSTYADGFMVPPFVKLTIGDFYRDQPGYIKAISHQIEEDVSWEITPGYQVPFGITMNITFCTVEKEQIRSTSTFYLFGES